MMGAQGGGDDAERYDWQDDEGRGWRRLLRDPWCDLVDERAYAAFRIAFSIVALANLINLWFYRDAFFTAGGMIPAEVVSEAGWHTRLSVFNLITGSWAVNLYFLVSATAIICLGLGVSPRIAAVLVLVWHLSYTYRAIPGCTGWDHVLRAYSFVVMVSPLGRCWSLRNARLHTLVPAYGISLMRLQVAVIYWQGICTKLTDKYWQDGEFLSYFLLSVHARWPHPRVAEWNDFLIPVTYFAILIEIAIPVLLFIPRTRRIGFVLGFSFHLLIAIMGRHLFFFSLTMWMTYVAFIGTGTLDRAEQWVRGRLRLRQAGAFQAP
jgi:hypothetical protein